MSERWPTLYCAGYSTASTPHRNSPTTPSAPTYLPGHPGLAVSISHCRQAVAVALNPAGSIGIDIECRRKINPELIRRVCTRQEQAAILASDDPEMEFLRYWTRKEAVLKCRGTGIRGFGSMQQALADSGCHVYDIPCGIPDTTAAIAITMAV